MIVNQWKDIIQVSLPLPFALKQIHSYLIKGEQGYTIIDTGLHTEEDIQVWKKVQEEVGFTWNEVEKIVLTHYHPDHYGLAGQLQEWTGAPVYISKTDYEQAQMFFGQESDYPEILTQFFQKHGLTDEWAVQVPEHMRSFRKWMEPHPQPTFIQSGDVIRLGDREYEVIHTPGHADGHLSFYDPERKWLIGGDFLLPKISPNISLWPGCSPNPLEDYLATLKKMKSLSVQKVFPSHGDVFDHYLERIEELEKHHEIRLERMRKSVEKKQKATNYDICLEVFGDNLTIHNLRFAMSETLAHLEYLRFKGVLKTEELDGKVLYSCK